MDDMFITNHTILSELRKLGFDKDCVAFYDNSVSYLINENEISLINGQNCNVLAIPTFDQVVDWFNEVHNLHIAVLPLKLNDKFDKIDLCYYYTLTNLKVVGNICCNADDLNASSENFESHKKAKTEGILKAIETIKNK